ncbi:MAG: ABC transporter permease [Verrucomicrobia bacterium]|nr:ABC transporter permease [Verrucomicrobiota bacterium]
MTQILPLFKREFFGYFRSPVAYVFLIVFLVVSSGLTFYLGRFFDARVASLDAFFSMQPWIYTFFISAVGMRLWAEEKRSGTWELLLTLPVRISEAVMGKFLAGWAFIATGILLTFPLMMTVGYLGDPDWGPIFTGYVGSILMAGSFLAVCSFTSALTKNQVISFVISIVINLGLVFLGWSVFTNLLAFLPLAWVDALSNFSYTTHFNGFTRGLIAFKDLVFFLSLSFVSLLLTVLVLER